MTNAGHNLPPEARLRSFIERVERVEEEIKSLNADKSEIYKEARGQGYDVKVMRKVVAARKIDSAERDEQDALFDMYWNAVHGVSEEDPRVHAHEAGETGMVLGTGRERPLSVGLHTDGDPEARFETASLHHTNPVANAVEDAEATTGTATDEAVSRGADAADRQQPLAPGFTGDGEPVSHEPVSAEREPAPISDWRAKLRPHCRHPESCAGYGKNHCHACAVSTAQSEATA